MPLHSLPVVVTAFQNVLLCVPQAIVDLGSAVRFDIQPPNLGHLHACTREGGYQYLL